MNVSDEIIPRQPEQLAYIAGLFDGEGGICVYPSNYVPRKNADYGASRYLIMVSFRMCNEDIIRWLHSQLEGSRFQTFKPRKKEWSMIYECSWTGEKAVEFLKLIYPYLRVKKQQAAWLFKFLEVKKQIRYQADSHRAMLLDELYLKIKSFNKKMPSGKNRLKKNRGAVETERSAPSNGMKFQSDLVGDSENVLPVTV